MIIPPHWPEALQAATRKHLESLDLECRYEFADNFRFARQDNADEIRTYQNAYDHGCCGFYDTDLTVDGQTILIGFNYGH